ncbi:MAG TPA: hypothetical protein DHV36_22140 [Desulfobacteraceae bacterium]|nr:hypothetical protein [Desulfobacteraceae bacterium]|tara:strand:- start:354 stop:581 length:228 start_codon:yes stop_codon:yes gene_type:complete
MNLVPLSKAHKEGRLPIRLSTAYYWRNHKRYPALIIKLGYSLYFDFDEWDDMVRKAKEKQIEEAKRFKEEILKSM